jgi:uncharacterized membrane protein YfcA
MAAGSGAAVGVLAGLIGLGGAEFRLPLLIGLFGFLALEAVIVNKALSLLVVATALPARLAAVPLATLVDHWPILLNLLVGTLIGAWAWAAWATRVRSTTLHRVLAGLLVLMAAALLWSHFGVLDPFRLDPPLQAVVGAVAGVGIGVVAAVMGVAGGELLIPSLTVLFGVDIKTAGSLSLAISLPTMLVAFTRYSRDRSFAVLGTNSRFVVAMAAGSIAGTVVGGLLVGLVPDDVLVPHPERRTPGVDGEGLAALTRTRHRWGRGPSKICRTLGLKVSSVRGGLNRAQSVARSPTRVDRGR